MGRYVRGIKMNEHDLRRRYTEGEMYGYVMIYSMGKRRGCSKALEEMKEYNALLNARLGKGKKTG